MFNNFLKKNYLVISLLFLTTNVYTNSLSEYTLINSKPGWKIYSNDSKKIYIQEINLKYADVSIIHGAQNGEYFNKTSISVYWNYLYNSVNAYSVINGAFYERTTNKNDALSFPLKINSKILTYGLSADAPQERKILSFKNKCATGSKCAFVQYYSKDIFENNSKETMIVGLDPTFNKNANVPMSRTFAGVIFETNKDPLLYFVYGEFKTQGGMVDILNSLGVYDDQIIMFDGHGSSQMAFKDSKNITNFKYGDNRLIPQVFVVHPKIN